MHFTVATNSAPQSTATTPGTARTIFGRLGIRKPSILSLSSQYATNTGGETARTFSLDDLLRPPPRRKTDRLFYPLRNTIPNQKNHNKKRKKDHFSIIQNEINRKKSSISFCSNHFFSVIHFVLVLFFIVLFFSFLFVIHSHPIYHLTSQYIIFSPFQYSTDPNSLGINMNTKEIVAFVVFISFE